MQVILFKLKYLIRILVRWSFYFFFDDFHGTDLELLWA